MANGHIMKGVWHKFRLLEVTVVVSVVVVVAG